MFFAHFLANRRLYGRFSAPPAVTACFVSSPASSLAASAVGFSNVSIPTGPFLRRGDGPVQTTPVGPAECGTPQTRAAKASQHQATITRPYHSQQPQPWP